MIGPNHERDRGLTAALTHVLTIGITTILIAMLMMGASAMLEAETERSTETSLETVGERLAGEIDNVDQIASGEDDSATIVADHPSSVSNSQYTVELYEQCGNRDAPLIDSGTCLELAAHEVDVTVHVPVSADDIDDSERVSGGSIEISTNDDGQITIEEADR